MPTASDLAQRRRRAHYRASHRGTRELDIMLGRFASATLPGMDDPTLARFEAFLQRPEPELAARLLSPGGPLAGAKDSDLILAVRHFHGLGEAR